MFKIILTLLSSLLGPVWNIWQRHIAAKKISDGITNQHEAEANSESVTDAGYARSQAAKQDNGRLVSRAESDDVREQSAAVSDAIAAANRELRGESAK